MICTTCNGEGLVGGGDRPLEMKGITSVCAACGGTGNIIDMNADMPDEVEVVVPVEEVKVEPVVEPVTEALPIADTPNLTE